VRAVITGRVTTRGNLLIVQADLVDVRDGSQLWAASTTGPSPDILAIQDEISSEIFEKLRLRLTGDDKKRATKRYTENAEAYQLYLRGRYYWNQGTIAGYKKGDRTISSRRSARTRSTRSRTRGSPTRTCFWVRTGWKPSPKQRRPALKALELDRTLAEAHVSLGHIKLWLDWDWPAAEREFKQGIALNPNSALRAQPVRDVPGGDGQARRGDR